MLQKVLIVISAVSFLYYGMSFFVTSGMEQEFERYGLKRFRNLTGVLQLLGGCGLLVGLFYRPVLMLSSGGLALLMLLGFGVRIIKKDGFLQSMPSFIFMVLNFYIFIQSIQ